MKKAKQLNISNFFQITKEMKMWKEKNKNDRGGSVDIEQTIIPGCLIIPIIALLYHPLPSAPRLSRSVHTFHTLIIFDYK